MFSHHYSLSKSLSLSCCDFFSQNKSSVIAVQRELSSKVDCPDRPQASLLKVFSEGLPYI